MRIRIRIFYIFSVSGILLSWGVKAQDNSNYRKLINKTNTFYGSNDLLHSGEVYHPDHLRAKGNPYFFTNEYSPALVTVRGNVFENVTAKYNIETDQLIILTPADLNSITTISIKQNWVDSFKIQNHLFVNISSFDSTKTLKGYYELAYKGKKSFFIKYNKKFIDTYNDLSPSGFYSVVKTSIFIFDGTTFIPVKNKKKFLRIYADNKATVKKYMRINKILFSKATSAQFKQLMQYADGLSKSN
jgi:hypothetical protein